MDEDEYEYAMLDEELLSNYEEEDLSWLDE